MIAVGIPVGYVTGWLPPDRLVTFGFAVPIAAALGLVWVRGRLLRARPALATAVVLVLGGWMIVGPLLAWGRQAPFVSPAEAALAREASLRAWSFPLPDRPVVFIVDDADSTATFLGSRAANIVRAAADPAHAGDVFVFVGTATDYFEGRATVRGDPQFDALSRLTLRRHPARAGAAGPRPRPLLPGRRRRVASRPGRARGRACGHRSRSRTSRWRLGSIDVLGFGPASGTWISVAAIAILALLCVAGLGYARAAFTDVVTAIATAPAFGAAAITLTAVTLDRLGLRLESIPVAVAASALGGLGGLAVFLVVQRQRDRHAPS